MRTQNNTPLELYVRCPFGLERTVAAELSEMGIPRTRPLSGGVAFFGSLEQAYLACLWLRSASRVLLVLKRFSAEDAQALYEGAKATPWLEHLSPESSFSVHARGTNSELRNTQFTALKVKDALCDAFVELTGKRPNVDPHQPDIRLELSVRDTKATLYLDLSGEPLHRRGYRTPGEQGLAPLKENLAAGVLLLSGWNKHARPEALFDPLCGSGTLVLEAACIAFDRAPGLSRTTWGFLGWLGHNQALWERLHDEAEQRFATALSNAAAGSTPLLIGSDRDKKALALAQASAQRLGLADKLQFVVADLAKALTALPQDIPATGMLVSNPPYAHRIGREDELPALYRNLDTVAMSLPSNWSLHVLSPSDVRDQPLLRTPHQTETLYNGKIETSLKHYRLGDNETHALAVQSPVDGATLELTVFEAGTEQFAARLKKVARERKKWAKREKVSCYRLYDGDLPDYAVAIDRYEGSEQGIERVFYCVSEYKAPKEIDAIKAKRRYQDALTVVPAVLGANSSDVIPKQREQARGGSQYGASGKNATPLIVLEHNHTFLTDLSSYLDTGLFLDHRETRSLVGSLAKGKRFLNLFAYTGAATVYAAAGGAATTTTVDLSNTYLKWAQENLRLNGYSAVLQTGEKDTQGQKNSLRPHRLIRADALVWLKSKHAAETTYDLIFVDPPTFSNSKKMTSHSWSVQRDHVDLLRDVARLLSEDGRIIFSCNLRSFKLDYESLKQAGMMAEDITAQTIPHDFARNQKIHTCFLIHTVSP